MRVRLTKEENLERIYLAYAEDVYQASMYLTRDEDLSHEIVQQTFLKFYEKDVVVKPECEKAYLVRMARNLIYNYFRHSKFELYQKDEKTDCFANLTTDSLEDKHFENELRESREEFSAEILEAVREHNQEWYLILHSMFYLEKDHDEIAAELGITKEVLYSRLYRAKLWIRKHYKERLKDIENGT